MYLNSSNINDTTPILHSYANHLIFNIICVAVYILIILAALIGNTLVCLAFSINPMLRKSPTNFFIMSLAVSDILTVTLCVPFDVEQTLLNWQWNHGSMICSLWTTIYLFVVPSSILSLLAVSVDRYKCLVDPLNRFRQTRFMTRKRACVVITALWVYSFVFALVPEMGWKMFPSNIIQNSCSFNLTIEYSVLSSFLNFVLPVIGMCILYTRIYYTVKQMRQSNDSRVGISIISDNRRKGKHRKRLNQNIKITKNILIVVCTFFLCWMPYTLYTIISNLCQPCYYSMPQELPTIFLILGYSNSALNPYLYAFRNKQFKETFTKTLRTLHLLSDSKLSSRRRSFAHTNPSLLSESSCHTRTLHQTPERFTQSHPTSSV